MIRTAYISRLGYQYITPPHEKTPIAAVKIDAKQWIDYHSCPFILDINHKHGHLFEISCNLRNDMVIPLNVTGFTCMVLDEETTRLTRLVDISAIEVHQFPRTNASMLVPPLIEQGGRYPEMISLTDPNGIPYTIVKYGKASGLDIVDLPPNQISKLCDNIAAHIERGFDLWCAIYPLIEYKSMSGEKQIFIFKTFEVSVNGSCRIITIPNYDPLYCYNINTFFYLLSTHLDAIDVHDYFKTVGYKPKALSIYDPVNPGSDDVQV